MTASYYFSSSTFFQALGRMHASTLDMASRYERAYIHALGDIVGSNADVFQGKDSARSVPGRWFDATNRECQEHLCSKEFLGSLKEFADAAIQFWSWARMDGGDSWAVNLARLADELQSTFANAALQESAQETPSEVVYRGKETRLLHYRPAKDSGYRVPILLVYAPINRYHIMDIAKGRSIVEKFVSAGFDVFLLDWGKDQEKDKFTISDYIEHIDRSVEEIGKVRKSGPVSLLGYSWGGVLSIMYASIYGEKVKNLVIQSAQIDFGKDESTLARWIRNLPVDRYANESNVVSSRLINLAFIMRNPAIHSFDHIRYAIEMLGADDCRADAVGAASKFYSNVSRMVQWLNDTTYIPAEFFAQFTTDLYRQNRLINNQMSIRPTKTIDLTKVSMPLLNIVGEYDDLVPAASSVPLNDAVSSRDNKLLRFPAGHVELCLSADAHQRLWPQVVEWLQKRS